MKTLLASVRDLPNNPVLRREMDERAASTLAVLAVTLWLFLLGGTAALVYLGNVSGGANPITTDSARIGRQIFTWTLFVMIALVLFLIPAFTASSVAGERTRQTLVPLQMTAMSPLAIVLGKALAAIVFTVLLVAATAPILAVSFLVGGVRVSEVLGGLGIVALTAMMLGSVGVMFSAVASKVQGAIVATYGYVIMITVGSLIAFGVGTLILWVIQQQNADPNVFVPGTWMPPRQMLAINPFVGLASAVADTSGTLFDANPADGIASGLQDMEVEAQRFNRPGIAGFDPVSAPWRWYVVFCVLTIYSSLAVATNKLRTPAQYER